ncbi:MAG: glycosyltransferase [Pseudobutyrivibrio ruminis]|nr:glycosyltransferase [Pseudobutyrivibrio ruminis]
MMESMFLGVMKMIGDKISILVPCYNEEENVVSVAEEITRIMTTKLTGYEYEIIFRDNASTDNTVVMLRRLASKDNHIKVIVNSRNYGVFPDNNTFLGKISGNICIGVPCDLQDPLEIIVELVEWYEKGYEVVAGQKISSEEGVIKYGFRQLYYKILQFFSERKRVANISGSILMSKRIYEIYNSGYKFQMFDTFAADCGIEIKTVPYRQKKREHGKSSYNLARSFNYSINGLIQTSIKPIRIATVLGTIFSSVSFVAGLVYFILKIIFWKMFPAGTTPILLGMFFIGSIQLLFLGLIGEYVGQIYKLTTPSNPAVVSELINFDDEIVNSTLIIKNKNYLEEDN